MNKLSFEKLGSGYVIKLGGVGAGRVHLGNIDRDVDGFFYWFPPSTAGNGGSWSEWILRAIVEKLAELNVEPTHHLNAVVDREP